jgi:uncharacterized repeat protein (TIGR01451 family)
VWTAGNIANSSTFTLDVVGTALPTGSYTSTATRTASTPTDNNAVNDSATLTVTPFSTADVAIAHFAQANPFPTVGQNVTFRIQATNNGPGLAAGVVVQYKLPTGYAFVSKSAFQGTYDETTGVWTAGNIANSNTFTLDVTGTALATGSYTATATRTASIPTDPNAANDSATLTLTPFATADVGITNVVQVNPNPSVGQNVTFRIQATNSGPGLASGVVVQYKLPTGYAFVSKNPFQGTYDETTGVWTAGNISSGTPFTLDVVGTALASGNYTATATRTASAPTDPNAANDSATRTLVPIGGVPTVQHGGGFMGY